MKVKGGKKQRLLAAALPNAENKIHETKNYNNASWKDENNNAENMNEKRTNLASLLHAAVNDTDVR